MFPAPAYNGSFPSRFLAALVNFCVFMTVFSIGGRWYLIVLLVCISSVISDADHFPWIYTLHVNPVRAGITQHCDIIKWSLFFLFHLCGVRITLGRDWEWVLNSVLTAAEAFAILGIDILWSNHFFTLREVKGRTKREERGRMKQCEVCTSRLFCLQSPGSLHGPLVGSQAVSCSMILWLEIPGSLLLHGPLVGESAPFLQKQVGCLCCLGGCPCS